MRRSKSLEAYLDLRDNKSPNLERGASQFGTKYKYSREK